MYGRNHTLQKARTGFSLIELLLCLALLALLVGFLLPAVIRVQEAASRTKCASHLKQIGLAVHAYHDTYRALPPSRLDALGAVSWTVLLLPYLDQDSFFREWDLHQPYYTESAKVRQVTLEVFQCPSRVRPPVAAAAPSTPTPNPPPINLAPTGAFGDFAVCGGDQMTTYQTASATGAMVIALAQYGRPGFLSAWSSRTCFASITDGVSNTLLIGEKHIPLPDDETPVWQDGPIYNGSRPDVVTRVAGPRNLLAESPLDEYDHNFGSPHPGVCQFVFCDGSVHALSVDIEGALLGRLAARNDGQPVTDLGTD